MKNERPEKWAHETCFEICAASDLKEICKARGFSNAPKNSGKSALAEYVEMRITGAQGVREVLATLDVPSLWALHALKCAASPVEIGEIHFFYWGAEYVTPHFHLLDAPEKVYNRLEQLEQVPGKIRHGDRSLHESLLSKAGPAKARTPAKPAPTEERRKISLAESSLLGFKSSNVDFIGALVMHLKEVGVVPVFFDESEGMIAIPDTARPQINAFIKRIRTDCIVEMR